MASESNRHPSDDPPPRRRRRGVHRVVLALLILMASIFLSVLLSVWVRPITPTRFSPTAEDVTGWEWTTSADGDDYVVEMFGMPGRPTHMSEELFHRIATRSKQRGGSCRLSAGQNLRITARTLEIEGETACEVKVRAFAKSGGGGALGWQFFAPAGSDDLETLVRWVRPTLPLFRAFDPDEEGLDLLYVGEGVLRIRRLKE